MTPKKPKTPPAVTPDPRQVVTAFLAWWANTIATLTTLDLDAQEFNGIHRRAGSDSPLNALGIDAERLNRFMLDLHSLSTDASVPPFRGVATLGA